MTSVLFLFIANMSHILAMLLQLIIIVIVTIVFIVVLGH